MSNLELKGLKGLKGLDVLLNDVKQPKNSTENLLLIPTEDLISSRYQPRTCFDDASLMELASSIQEQGILQPLIVRKADGDKFEIIAGERRWRAAKLAGLHEVPALVRPVPDATALAFALIENVQREDLNPLDHALALARLQNEFSLTHEELAKSVGCSRSNITNLLRLLSLSVQARAYLHSGQLEMGHARALLVLDEEQQILAAQEVIARNLSVRETEKLVQKIKQPVASRLLNPIFEEKCQEWGNLLSTKLSLPVTVKLNREGEGRVVIKVESEEKLKWLLGYLDKTL